MVYASKFTKTETSDAGEAIGREIPFLKEYTVFNGEQIEGLPKHFLQLAEAVRSEPLQRIEQAETFFKNTGAEIRTGGNQAYYAFEADYSHKSATGFPLTAPEKVSLRRGRHPL